MAARISKSKSTATADAITRMVEANHKQGLKLKLIAAVLASRWQDACEYLDLLLPTPEPAAPVEATEPTEPPVL